MMMSRRRRSTITRTTTAIRRVKRPARTDALPPPTPSEAAFERLLAGFGSRAPATPVGAFLDDLYARSEEFNRPERYASIGESHGFNTKLVGVTFEGRQDLVAGLAPGAALSLERDPANPYDANAVGVWLGGLQLGFIKKEIAARIAPNIDAGERYRAEVRHVTGGGTRSTGVNVWVSRDRAPATLAQRERGRAADVLHALLGDSSVARGASGPCSSAWNQVATPLRSSGRAAANHCASSTRLRYARSSATRRRSCCIRCARSPTISTMR